MADVEHSIAQAVTIPGRGAFVTLHYHGGALERDEHSIIFLPDNWISLKDLLRTPEPFMAQVRSDFTQLPSTEPWRLSRPMTINIEPLTIPTQENLVLLKALAPLYPAFAGSVGTLTDQFSLGSFRQKVINGAEQHALNIADLQYIIEFALKTRVMSIKYIPRTQPVLSVFNSSITDVTISRVQGTNLAFIHFDIQFAVGTHDHYNVAKRRSELAYDYLADPKAFVERLFMQGGLSFRSTNGAMMPTGGPLTAAPVLGSVPKPVIKKPTLDPSVVMDSVEPDPNPGANPPDPPPAVCGKITVTEGPAGTFELGTLLLKGYPQP